MAVIERPNIIQRVFQRVRQIIQETVGELRKVNWPTRQEAWNLTKIVIIVLVSMGLLLGAWDFACSTIFRLLLGA
jgi:preprotein translocase subunit SecE